jgi:hypothetical protein
MSTLPGRDPGSDRTALRDGTLGAPGAATSIHFPIGAARPHGTLPNHSHLPTPHPLRHTCAPILTNFVTVVIVTVATKRIYMVIWIAEAVAVRCDFFDTIAAKIAG